VKKDAVPEPWFELPRRSFEPERVLEAVGGSSAAPERFAGGFPEHLHSSDVSLKLAGAGGDGAQTAAMLITLAGIQEGFDATHIPSYGPESRGGTSYADVHVAREEVLSPASPHPNVLIAFNAPSLAKFGPEVAPGAIVLYDSTVIAEPPSLADGVAVYGVPFTQIAIDAGRAMVKNIAALGALCAATRIFPKETFLSVIRRALREKSALIPANEEAFARGAEAIPDQMFRPEGAPV
jgi:Pyruvate/2-oxoacid:ferredoxin oxidoreductase gamma subunit